MDFDANSLLASLLVSSIGFVLVVYGKKMSRAPQFITGVILLVFPYFVSGALLILGIGTALVGLLWFFVKNGW